MNSKQAQQAGVSAYQAGRGRAPSLNASFTKSACAAASGKALCALLDDYIHGWDVANLAAGAISTSPSVAELVRINQAVAQ